MGIELVRDIVVGVSAIVVAVVAFFGLRTWRRELTGKAKFDVARNMMLLGFKLRADFQWVRHISTSSWEFAGRQQQENESEDASRVLNEWYAKRSRLQPLIENLQKFQEAGWEAEIVLGEDSSRHVLEAITVFRESYGDLSSAIESYFETRHEEVIKGDMYHDQDWLKELRKIIYSVSRDDFSKRIEGATERLSSALKVYVK